MKKPEQKAEELIEKFKQNIMKNGNPNNLKKHSIQCAIICVDEIIKSSPSLPILSDAGNYVNDIEESTEYWQEVKQILENKL